MLRQICAELNHFTDLKPTLVSVLDQIRSSVHLEAVSVRLHDDGDYPYYVYDGFPDSFIHQENSLCSKDGTGERIRDREGRYLLDCMCGNVIRGHVDHELPFFTDHGSFFSGHTTALLASSTEEDRQGRTRNFCNSCGYETVVLVPIRARGETIGLLQLNDHRRHALREEMLRTLEDVGDQIGAAVSSSLVHEKLKARERELVSLTGELEQARAELEGRVAERTQELEAANAQLRNEIAERLRTQAELVRLERQKALSEMAAGISHNLNNILMSIQFPAQHLQARVQGAELQRQAETITEATGRAAELVKRLHRAMCPDAASVPTVPVDVSATVEYVIRETEVRRAEQYPGVTIATETATEALALATPGELGELILNLFLNAMHAMPGGGTIQVETKDLGSAVQLRVRDDGTGMDEETRRRVFEPFFTTKQDVGSGLGLATAAASVRQWGGEIAVESQVDVGTMFTVRLPSASPPAPVGSAPISPIEAALPTGRRRVLMVEDDADVSEMVADHLGDRFAVETTSSGGAAVEACRDDAADIYLIDLGLPDISGDRVARVVKEAHPDAVTVLLTGYPLRDGDERLSGFDLWVQKPASPTQIDEAMERAAELVGQRRPQS